MTKILILLIPLTFIHLPLLGAEITLSLDRSLMFLTGDKIHLTFYVKHSPNEKLLFHDSDIDLKPKDFFSKFFKMRYLKKNTDIEPLTQSREKKKVVDKTGKILIINTFHYYFQVFELETIEISPIKFVFLKNKNTYAIYSPYSYIHALPPSLAGNPKLIYKDISEPNFDNDSDFFSPFNLYLQAFSLIIVLYIFLFYRIKKRNLIKNDTLHNPTYQAYKRFSLHRENSSFVGNRKSLDSLKNLYLNMALTLKYYIERVVPSKLLEKNTEETLLTLESKIQDTQILSQIKEFLYLCDEIKFAVKDKSKTEVYNDIKMGENIIKELEHLKDPL